MAVAAEIVGWTICAISGWHGIETVANLGPLLAGVTLIPHLGVGLLLVVAGRDIGGSESLFQRSSGDTPDPSGVVMGRDSWQRPLSPWA